MTHTKTYHVSVVILLLHMYLVGISLSTLKVLDCRSIIPITCIYEYSSTRTLLDHTDYRLYNIIVNEMKTPHLVHHQCFCK